MSANNETLRAWAGVANGKPLVQMDLPLTKWDENSVEIRVAHYGICGSDDHMLSESWGPTHYPICVGHEIVGEVTKVGSNVTNLKVGNRAGIGAQSGSCHQCKNCLEGNENICPKSVLTYDYRFAFKIPDKLSSHVASTFFCAGITTYAPLKRIKVGKGSVVDVMGIGGLVHYGVLWAKALGAKTVGMSHNDKKHDNNTLTHILCTGTSPDFQWAPYFPLLVVNGNFINVSAPNWNFPLLLLLNQIYIHGSAIGSPAEIEDMLTFAEEHNIKPWIDVYPMKDVNKVLDDFRAGKPRLRYVLEN
ncbi:chaperonin 10-like protein [Parasitella parasitica]|nr:chaperonin 10-like protein [Parasitella parasitica]